MASSRSAEVSGSGSSSSPSAAAGSSGSSANGSRGTSSSTIPPYGLDATDYADNEPIGCASSSSQPVRTSPADLIADRCPARCSRRWCARLGRGGRAARVRPALAPSQPRRAASTPAWKRDCAPSSAMASANRARTVRTETPSCRAIISSETPWAASRSTCTTPSPRRVHGSGIARGPQLLEERAQHAHHDGGAHQVEVVGVLRAGCRPTGRACPRRRRPATRNQLGTRSSVRTCGPRLLELVQLVAQAGKRQRVDRDERPGGEQAGCAGPSIHWSAYLRARSRSSSARRGWPTAASAAATGPPCRSRSRRARRPRRPGRRGTGRSGSRVRRRSRG